MITAEQFRALRDRDFANLPPDMQGWIGEWHGDMSGANIGLKYDAATSLATYVGGWDFDWPRMIDVDAAHVARSAEITSRVLRARGHDAHGIHKVDPYNAEDFRFARVTEWRAVKAPRVLDFGPGYGRQINLWGGEPGLVYCGVEAIENAYCVQADYYALATDLPITDYVAEPDKFVITDTPGIYHVPTWRMDLLPDGFFDKALCVQVLPEIGPKTLVYTIRQMHRVLKPGGVLYVRDLDIANLPGNTYDTDAILPQLGFALELRAYLRDWDVFRAGYGDVCGIPRIWRKTEAEYTERRLDPRLKGAPVADVSQDAPGVLNQSSLL